MPGTTDFDLLCPHGIGSTFDGNDINECAQNPNICQNGACENMIGTYRCICNPGFEVDETGKICSDINECEVEQLVSLVVAKKYTVIINVYYIAVGCDLWMRIICRLFKICKFDI
jgi:hypothetical protein